MLQNPLKAWALLIPAMLLAACAIPGSRENSDAAKVLVATQTPVPAEWRRDPAADAAAKQGVAGMLSNGISLQEAVGISFLSSPELQLAFEQLEVARGDLVAASTPPNPVAIVGVREPGGRLSVFYPDQNISVGVLMNVLALLNMPDRRAIARHELDKQRLLTAERITQLAARVTEAWLDHAAALQIEILRERAAAAARAAIDTLIVQAANGSGVTALDVAVERNGLFATEGAHTRAAIETATSRAKLGELLGIAGLHDRWTLEGALPPLPDSDPPLAMLESRAMAQRFDLQAGVKAIDARLRVLATQRRFRWLGMLELGAFHERAVGGTPFTGPNAAIELPVFDQHQAQLLAADSELRSAQRQLEAARLAAYTQLRIHAAELAATRALLTQYELEVRPNQQQIAAALGTGSDPGQPDRLSLRLALLAAEEEHAGLLRDYWRARSALALAAGEWNGLSGLAAP